MNIKILLIKLFYCSVFKIKHSKKKLPNILNKIPNMLNKIRNNLNKIPNTLNKILTGVKFCDNSKKSVCKTSIVNMQGIINIDI